MMQDGKSDSERIGERIIELRLALGYQVAAAFARKAGVSPQLLSEWERGNNRPNVDNARKIRAATGVTHDWLMDGENFGNLPSELRDRIRFFREHGQPMTGTG